MRIGIYSQYFYPEGGAASQRVTKLAEEWSRSGHQITVVAAFPNYPSGQKKLEDQGRWMRRETWKGIRVVHTYVYAHPRRSAVRRFINYMSYAISALLATPDMRTSDLLVFSSGPLFVAIPCLFTSYLFRRPMIMDLRDLWPERAVKGGGIARLNPVVWLMYLLEWCAYRRASIIVTATRGLRDRLLSRGVTADKLRVVFNGIDVEKADKVLEEARTAASPWRTEAFRLVESGTIGLLQAPETSLKAVHILQGDDPEWGELAVLGHGPKLERCRGWATRHGLATVRFMGYVPECPMYGYLSSAHAGLVTLTRDPINEMAVPRRMFDYLAASVPVIYSGSGEGASLVREHGAGIVTPPEDPEALAAAVAWMRDHPSEARAMGARGRSLLEDHFEFRAASRDYLRSVVELLDGRRAPVRRKN